MEPLIFKTFLASVIFAGPFVGLLLSVRPSHLAEPPYLLEVEIEPVFENDWQSLVQLLQSLAEGAGAFIEQREQKIFIQALSDLQVESIVARLRGEHEIEFKLGEPDIFYYFRRASQQGDLFLWEPVMKVKVVTPESFAEKIRCDLRKRRGEILDAALHRDAYRICALVPLGEMLGYSDVLRSTTEGEASYTIIFHHFSRLPPDDDSPKRPTMIMRT